MHNNSHNQEEAAVTLAKSRFSGTAASWPNGDIVRFLTQNRRQAVTRPTRGARLALLLLLPFGLSAASATSTVPAWQPVEEIAESAKTYLASHLDVRGERTKLKASPLDPRLQLPRCSEPLEPFLQRGAKVSRRMTVGVGCNGEKPWKIYVTVDVVVTDSVLVAARSVPSGHVLTAADLGSADRDVSGLTSGYLHDPDQVIGRRLKHNLVEGRVLTPIMLKEDLVVHRGQSVTLTIQSDSLDIRMEGKALMDGHVNQRIRVENTLSRRVVEGIVRSPQHVEILVF